MWNEVKNRFVDVWVALQGIPSGAKAGVFSAP